MWDRAALTPTLRHWTFPNKRKENRSRKLYEVFSKEKKITLPQDNRSIPVLKSGHPNPNATALVLPNQIEKFAPENQFFIKIGKICRLEFKKKIFLQIISQEFPSSKMTED